MTYYARNGPVLERGSHVLTIVTPLAIDWVMMSITHGIRQGLQWALNSVLKDLDYADDLGLVPSRRHYTAEDRAPQQCS